MFHPNLHKFNLIKKKSKTLTPLYIKVKYISLKMTTAPSIVFHKVIRTSIFIRRFSAGSLDIHTPTFFRKNIDKLIDTSN